MFEIKPLIDTVAMVEAQLDNRDRKIGELETKLETCLDSHKAAVQIIEQRNAEIARLQSQLDSVTQERDALQSIIDEANTMDFDDEFAKYHKWLIGQVGDIDSLSPEENAMIEACRDASLVVRQHVSRLGKIFEVGHNDECLFCGFKDRIAKGIDVDETCSENCGLGC